MAGLEPHDVETAAQISRLGAQVEGLRAEFGRHVAEEEPWQRRLEGQVSEIRQHVAEDRAGRAALRWVGSILISLAGLVAAWFSLGR